MNDNSISINEINLDSQAVVPRQLLTDKRLSRDAAMFFMEMVSWQQVFHGPVKCKADALDASPGMSDYMYFKLTRELESLGYLRRKRTHGDDGRFGRVEFSLLVPDVPEDKSAKRSYWQSRRDNGLPDYSETRNPRSSPLVEPSNAVSVENAEETRNRRSSPLVESTKTVTRKSASRATHGKPPRNRRRNTHGNRRNRRSEPLVETSKTVASMTVGGTMPLGDASQPHHPRSDGDSSGARAHGRVCVRMRTRNEQTPYYLFNTLSSSEGLPWGTTGCSSTDNVSERRLEDNQDGFVCSNQPKSGGYETVKELRAKTSGYQLKNCSEEQAMEIFDTAYAHSECKGFRSDQLAFSMPIIDRLMDGDQRWKDSMMEAVRQRGAMEVRGKLPSYWLSDGVDELMFSAERIAKATELEELYGKPIFT